MKYILKIDCKDEKGLIYRISDVVFKYRLNIEKNHEFVDEENKRFFLRALLEGNLDENAFIGTLEALLPDDANIFISKRIKKNIILFATKESHCLGDFLIRNHSGELNANILCVISNHESLKSLVDKFDIPYHFISHENIDRKTHEENVIEVLKNYNFDLIILAKYMRILSPFFVNHFVNKMINIHHSFLPAFIGANPYKQAYERGVKIIGATAHFVNDNLDEGPIIAQDIKNITHEMSWQQMQKEGKNVEKAVLSYAVDLALDDRIFINHNKTIIF